MSKRQVAVLCGGQSAEHEVSLLSARSVVQAIDRRKYDVTVVGIDQTGRWFLFPDGEAAECADNAAQVRLRTGGIPVALLPAAGGPVLRSLDATNREWRVEAVFPVMHGTNCEDGAIQGLCKLAGMPFVGPGVLGSAVGMDKDVMKRLLRDAGLPVGAFRTFTRATRSQVDFAALERELGMPVFVKPANLGSSVGIHKAGTPAELAAAVADAFRYDRKIVIEKYLPGREIECAVLGNWEPLASLPGEVIPASKHGHYSYEAKYLDPDGAALCIPAKLDDATIARVRDLAIRTFQALNCEGLGRVDLFLLADGTLYVNEINTLPGFTSISMYPKLWAITGIPYAELIDRLFTLALERAAEEAALETRLPGKE